MKELQYPIWAIKRYDDEKEAECNPAGHPGINHAIWYWWDVDIHSTLTQHPKLTWEAAMNRIEHYNQYLVSSPFAKFFYERLDDSTWRYCVTVSGRKTTLATLKKAGRIENPESTYRWYRN